MLFVVLLIIRVILLSNDMNCNDIFAPQKNISNKEPHSTNTSEVTKCIEKFNNNNLRKSDAANIWQSLITLYEGISNIPDEILSVLRWVIPGINSSDYENLTFNNFEMIQNFGKDYNLTDDQLSAIADRVRKDFESKKIEDYTVYDLKALRNILCGFNASEIRRIRPSEYKEASDVIGQLECKSDVMTEFALLSIHEEAFGPAEKWDNDIKDAVGKVGKHLPRNK